MKKQLINGITYAYTKKGEGPALLLLHGFTGSKETWEPFMEKWCQHFTVIALDLIGHGDSDAPEDVSLYSMDHMVGDLFQLLELEHISTTHILGYSMGGRVAIAFAATYPNKVQSLILESCTAGISEPEERAMRVNSDRNLAKYIMEHKLEEFVNKWEKIPLFQSLQKRLSFFQKKGLHEQRLNNKKIGLANSLIAMGTGEQPSYWKELPYLHFPVLLLCGEEDEKFCKIMKQMTKFLSNATYKKISHASHVIHMEQSENFGTIVSEFLIKKGDF